MRKLLLFNKLRRDEWNKIMRDLLPAMFVTCLDMVSPTVGECFETPVLRGATCTSQRKHLAGTSDHKVHFLDEAVREGSFGQPNVIKVKDLVDKAGRKDARKYLRGYRRALSLLNAE